jgi:2-polyprenyl-3-methyl-5-hydroxy-6-metoxy-1,4-benzoquinol methylase
MRSLDYIGTGCCAGSANAKNDYTTMLGKHQLSSEKTELDRVSHWENVYSTKQTTEVSWFEAEPTTSLNVLDQLLPQGGRIIDVGGGASFLVDRLVEKGNWDVTVLDIASTAIKHTRKRLGEVAGDVHWICEDITETKQLMKYEVWHDRAVFHFLTNPIDRQAYLDRLNESLIGGGYVVVATFAPDGPEKCSGLPVCRYSVDELANLLGKEFKLSTNSQLVHLTPTGKIQQFTLAVFQKV